MHAPSTIPASPTYDDLIDLHFLLEADELFLQLMGDTLLVGGVR